MQRLFANSRALYDGKIRHATGRKKLKYDGNAADRYKQII